MPELTNRQRADRIHPAVRQYGWEHLEGDTMEDTITDMVADLFHLAQREHLDVDRIAEMARFHFDEELDGEGLSYG